MISGMQIQVTALETHQVILHAVLKALTDVDQRNFLLVDSRIPAECRETHTPGVVNLPLKNIAAGSGILVKKKVIVVCRNAGGGAMVPTGS